VMVKFSSVRFFGSFARTPNRTLSSVQGICLNPELNHRFRFTSVRFRFGEGLNAELNVNGDFCLHNHHKLAEFPRRVLQKAYCNTFGVDIVK
jgi:hypothetical protein